VQDGSTPLHKASEKGRSDVVELLLALEGGEELAKAGAGGRGGAGKGVWNRTLLLDPDLVGLLE
jgi:hypothetical protein